MRARRFAHQIKPLMALLTLTLVILALVLPSISVGADTAKPTPTPTPTVSVIPIWENNKSDVMYTENRSAVSNYADVMYTGNHYSTSKGVVYEYTSRIYTAPVYNDDGSKVDTSWHTSGRAGEYTIIDNIFSVSVVGSEITVGYHGESISWNPEVYIDSTKYIAKGNAVINGANTLEWDYGVCTRRLVISAGLVTETWVFSKNPEGTVWIKDNAEATQGFVWQVTPYAYDAKGKNLVINEYKQVASSEFKDVVYPVTIDPTLSFIADQADSSQNIVKGDAVYLTAWNATRVANFGINVTDPTVITNSATYALVASARLNGLLSSDGGEACNVGFEYSLWNGSAWGTAIATANQSKVSGETFFKDLSGLANSSTYRFRALAGNSHTTVYGAYINFSTTTTVYAPTNMLCSPHSTSIDLSWAKGVNSVNTSIRWKTGGYPTDISDGTGLPNQSGVSYSHTGLASGTSYYYRLWGVDGTVVSATNSTLICTTLAPIGNTSTITTPTVPDNWVGAVDDSELSVLPIYGVGNEIADTINVPHPTFWMWSGVGFIILLSIVVYARTKNLFLTVLLATVVMVALGVLRVVPLAAVAIFLLGVFALITKEWQTSRETG